jgi:hypothetical protein
LVSGYYAKTPKSLGTVIKINGFIKVKWDGGRTSYFRRDTQANIQLPTTGN